ncbi:MAG TPA: LacI family DNA-binding transcriptional regulator [Longimicrobiaceae bacterium]|nr:LacI family DNA-binding transcriptional regulator [Longimicrobiaceae bacterium]
MKNPTISDVAALAGVSKATVSAVLNDKPTTRASTRRSVLRAIDRLGYRPSPAARRRFRPGAERSICFLVKEAANPYYAEALLGAQEVASEHGYLLEMISSEGDYATERRVVEQAMEREIGGLVLTPILNDDVDLSHVFELKRNNIPFVLMEEVRGIRADLVDVDNTVASAAAIRFLIEQGHTRIVHLAGPSYSSHSEERSEGVRRAFSESRLVFDESMVVPTGASAAQGYRAALSVFRAAGADRPTAVTCYNDMVAVGLLRALRELGLRVPEDVSVIGFDDLELLEYYPLPLTTMHVPKREIGRRAVELLLRRIESPAPRESAPERVLFEAPLVVRESTAPPRGRE